MNYLCQMQEMVRTLLLSYSFSCKMEGFPLQNNPKNLDPSSEIRLLNNHWPETFDIEL